MQKELISEISSPLVSFIITTSNHQKEYLVECINSILQLSDVYKRQLLVTSTCAVIWSVMEDGAGLWYCGKLSAIFIRYVVMILFRCITINLCLWWGGGTCWYSGFSSLPISESLKACLLYTSTIDAFYKIFLLMVACSNDETHQWWRYLWS